jgi:hypothetical protein
MLEVIALVACLSDEPKCGVVRTFEDLSSCEEARVFHAAESRLFVIQEDDPAWRQALRASLLETARRRGGDHAVLPQQPDQ